MRQPRERIFETAKEILVDNGDVIDLNYSPYITGNEKVFDIRGKTGQYKS